MNLRNLVKSRKVKIQVEDAGIYGLIAKVTGISNESIRLTIQEYVEANLAFDATMIPTFIGDFAQLPINTQIVVAL